MQRKKNNKYMHQFKNCVFVIFSFLVPQLAVASTMGKPHPWSITGSLGYTYYLSSTNNQGQTAVERLAIGKELFNLYLFKRYQWFWGLELGVQNGNSMNLAASEEQIEALGGLPIFTTIKPMPDLLVTIKSQEIGYYFPMHMQVKGGVAFRHLQFNDRDSIKSRLELSGEVQAGPAWNLNKVFTLAVLYQGIFGGAPNLQINEENMTGFISAIPMQHGGLVSLTLTL
jgi:hypothetical protein